ncbi:hypothetical protein [Haliangium ochraceum]|uniref:hypothetical protein n=1 Tax=Haliangium ochraceum TaxID=80816 RepID=UPI0002FDA571|nr:hypothetical protein [Haliangium ochraceum]
MFLRPQLSTMALSASERHIDRLAPERGTSRRVRSLGALAFADRRIGRYLGPAQRNPLRMFATEDSAAEEVAELAPEPANWLFPRPWYEDELGWLEAARQGAAAAAAAGVRTPTRAPAGRVVTAQPGNAGVSLGPAATAGAASGLSVAPLSLELIAPSLRRAAAPSRATSALRRGPTASAAGAAGGRAPSIGGAAPMSSARASDRALRVWSPLVAFSAVQAAELIHGVFSPEAKPAGDSAMDARPALAPEPVFVAPQVTPQELAPSLAARENQNRAASPSTGRGGQVSESLRNRLQETLRQIETRQRARQAAVPTSASAAAAPSAPAPAQVTAAAANAAPAASAPSPTTTSADSTSPTPATAAAQTAAQTATNTSTQTPRTAETARSGAAFAASARERAAELMVRAVLAGGSEIAPVSGPRLAMPAGLGGLIAGVRASQAVARPVRPRGSARPSAGWTPRAARPVAGAAPGVAGDAAALPMVAPSAPVAAEGSPAATSTAAMTAPAASAPFAALSPQRSAYRAVTAAVPNAVGHVAWADRWLARFAGASSASLAALQQTSTPVRADASAADSPWTVRIDGAPEPVFLAAPGDGSRPQSPTAAPSSAQAAQAQAQTQARQAQEQAARAAAQTAPAPAAQTSPTGVTSRPATPGAALRIDDDASVSDDVFAAIAAAAADSRAARRGGTPQTRAGQGAPARSAATPPAQTDAQAPAAPAEQSPAAAASVPSAAGAVSMAAVERLLAAAPSAPGAGMRVALSSSPVAPALRTLLPLPSSPGFDVRAMHASAWAETLLSAPAALGSAAAGPLARAVPFAFAGLAPAAAGSGAEAEATSLTQRAALGLPLSEFVAPDGISATATPATPAQNAPPAASARTPQSAGTAAGAGIAPASTAAASGAAAPSGAAAVSGTAAAMSAFTGAAAGAAAPRAAQVAAAAQYGAAPRYEPGQTAAQAEVWARATEQRAADLAFDFVSPELVLAAQAYGFSPGQAARAARLSVAGPAGMAALAAAVDLKLLDAFSASAQPANAAPSASPSAVTSSAAASPPRADVPGRAAVPASAVAPAAAAASNVAAATGDVASNAAPPLPALGEAATTDAIARAAVASATGYDAWGMPAMSSQAALSGPARAPRGAFLWPSGTLLAMNLDLDSAGAESDSALPLALAALDLMAADAVAQMGALVAGAPEPATSTSTAAGDAELPRSVATPQMAASVRAGAALPAAAAAAEQGAAASAVRALRARLGGAFGEPLAPEVIAFAAAPDSELAAGAPHAVYVTPDLDIDALSEISARGPGASGAAGTSGATGATAAAGTPGAAGSDMPVTAPGALGQASEDPSLGAAALGFGPGLAASRSQLPPQFEALYVALARSPQGRSLSPAVRAARALALAGAALRPGGSVPGAGASAAQEPPSARARAAAAWAVLPMVLNGGGEFGATDTAAPAFAGAAGPGGADAPLTAGAYAGALAARRPEAVFSGAAAAGRRSSAGQGGNAQRLGSDRPELQSAVNRAGESLQAFVAPSAAPQDAPAGRSGSAGGRASADYARGAVSRAPSAAQPMVQTGQKRAETAAMQQMIRSAQQQRATGDATVPSWFEEAARRMFDGGGAGGDGITLAEMTLVTAAPVRQVAASPRSTSSGAAASSGSPAASDGSESQDAEPTANVEQLAREVYAEICRMIAVARDRNGDTWR